MPEISVIVPVYKVEKYLRRCVDSILLQSFTDFELILVDDGSPDGSGAICDEYAQRDTRVQVIHQENSGLSAARNAGIDAAAGEYLLFTDSDDLIHPNTLEWERQALQESGADIALCSIQRFSHIDEIQEETGAADYLEIDAEDKLFEEKAELARYVSSCGKLYRRELFSDLRFPVGRLFEDEFVIYRLYHASNKVVEVNRTLYYYYVNSSGITQTLTMEKRFDEYDAQAERIAFYQNLGERELCAKALLHFLRTARWDLISYEKNRFANKSLRGEQFLKNYRNAMKAARKENLVSFPKDFDYYILAYPERKLLYRIARKIVE